MYNLLVCNEMWEWDGKPYTLEIGRCVREYTSIEITKKYAEFTQSQIDEIRRFPCVFAYEVGRKKDPKFGIIRDITNRQGKVKIEYEIIKLDNFLSHSDISTMLFDLDILDFEMNRTHWAIKEVNLSRQLALKGIRLPQWTHCESKAVDITKHEFDVALSFPGEVRDYIKLIVAELEKEIGPNSYFYDKNYEAQLARPSLDDLLQDIYKNRSKLVVVFLCEKYQEKEWCGIEFRAIKEIIMGRQYEKVMYVKMDDGEVQGVFKTDGYINGRVYSPADVARFIQQRISLLP